MEELVKIFKKEKTNEWVSGAIPGLLLHMCLSMIYCWSLIKTKISDFIIGDTSWAFSIMVAVLALTAIFAAPWIERKTKDAARYGAVLFFLGLIGSGLACELNSLFSLYLFYGFFLGMGAGLLYRVPLNMLSKWFKGGNKGFVGKVFMIISACSSFIMVPFIQTLMDEYNIVTMFLAVGIICFTIQMIASHLLEDPKGYKPARKRHQHYINRWRTALDYFPKLPGFAMLWILFFINLSCGLAVISCERDFMMVSGFAIVLGITLSRVVNPIGKGIFARIINKLGRGKAYKIWWYIYGFNLMGILISFISRDLIWVGVLMISVTYGASFSVQPSLLADFYGRKIISKAYPMLLTAWAVAGLFGNQIAVGVFNSNSGFYGLLFLLGLVYMVGLMLSLILRWVYKVESEKLSEKEVKSEVTY